MAGNSRRPGAVRKAGSKRSYCRSEGNVVAG